MTHLKIHSFTGTSDHDFSGLISDELIKFDGTNIVSAGPILPNTTVSNGLTKTGNNITLGGSLTGNTSINALAHNFYMSGNSGSFSQIKLESFHPTVSNKSSFITVGSTTSTLESYSGNTSNFHKISVGIGSSSMFYSPDGGFTAKGIIISELSNQFIIQDSIDEVGINYLDNYHTNYTNRTLVDKEYVDLKIPLPTISDKGLVVLTATTGNNFNTGIQISNTPYNLSNKSQYVGASVNGVLYQVGNGVTNKNCYFSSDGTSGGVRLFSAITQSDYFVWNGVISEFELDVNDRIDFYYNI